MLALVHRRGSGLDQFHGIQSKQTAPDIVITCSREEMLRSTNLHISQPICQVFDRVKRQLEGRL